MGLVRVSAPLILAASLLSSLAQAAPAPRALKARDYVTDIATETVWTTVDVTTTIYVDELPFTSAEMTTSAEEDSLTSTSGPETTSTSAPVAPAPEPASSEPASSEQAPATSTSAAGEFAESSAPPAPVYTSAEPPAPAYTPPAPAPPASPEAPAPAPVGQASDNSGSSGGSESATCEGASSSCKGDITHYDGGLGACGTTVDTEGDMAIALPHEFMGSQSNSNPYCGKSVTVKNPVSGTTVQGTVRDKCMGCVGRSIDLTNKMFNAVTDGKGDGRVKNMEWWFD